MISFNAIQFNLMSFDSIGCLADPTFIRGPRSKLAWVCQIPFDAKSDSVAKEEEKVGADEDGEKAAEVVGKSAGGGGDVGGGPDNRLGLGCSAASRSAVSPATWISSIPKN